MGQIRKNNLVRGSETLTALNARHENVLAPYVSVDESSCTQDCHFESQHVLMNKQDCRGVSRVIVDN